MMAETPSLQELQPTSHFSSLQAVACAAKLLSCWAQGLANVAQQITAQAQGWEDERRTCKRQRVDAEGLACCFDSLPLPHSPILSCDLAEQQGSIHPGGQVRGLHSEQYIRLFHPSPQTSQHHQIWQASCQRNLQLSSELKLPPTQQQHLQSSFLSPQLSTTSPLLLVVGKNASIPLYTEALQLPALMGSSWVSLHGLSSPLSLPVGAAGAAPAATGLGTGNGARTAGALCGRSCTSMRFLELGGQVLQVQEELLGDEFILPPGLLKEQEQLQQNHQK